MKRPRRIKLVERKLQREGGGRGKIYGMAHFDLRLIEVDPRQRNRSFLDTICHETLHLLWPGASESKITRAARELSGVLWRARYRRVSL